MNEGDEKESEAQETVTAVDAWAATVQAGLDQIQNAGLMTNEEREGAEAGIANLQEEAREVMSEAGEVATDHNPADWSN